MSGLISGFYGIRVRKHCTRGEKDYTGLLACGACHILHGDIIHGRTDGTLHWPYLVSFSEGVSQLLAILESSDSKELKLLQLASLIFRSSH